MNKVIGVIAHVDAGKTTLSEGLLYHTDTIKKIGRVDHQNTHMDTEEIEKRRGITVFSQQALMKYKGDNYYLIDTPGHIDFSPEMERNLKVMDFAIVIISAVEGIQGHTETVWQLLRKHSIPVFFFVNKIDREGADVHRVLREIRENLTGDAVMMKGSLQDELDTEFIERIADFDYELMDMYLEDEYDKDTWIEHMRILIREQLLYPCFTGSALEDTGVVEFLDNLHMLTETSYESEGGFRGKVYRVRYDSQGNRVSFIKIIGGKLKLKDEISYRSKEEDYSEKINEIRLYNGKEYERAEEAEAGALVGVTGLTNSYIGMGMGGVEDEVNFDMIPALKSKVLFHKDILKEVIDAFKILSHEDSSLNVEWNQRLQELHISLMGIVQLEVLKDVLNERFGLSVEFGKPGIIYKETITDSAIGRGHFEPLKHYAEVHLKVEALPRNSGIIFENLCYTDDLTKGNQNLVKQHILEREHRGLLTGSPLTDLKISLIIGRSHNKHTSGGDFREAAYRALRQGLEKANNVLLEPFYDFKIKVETGYIGKVMADIQRFGGTFDPPQTVENKAIITGRASVASFMDYPNELLSVTGGKGSINLMVSGYDVCVNEKEVVERMGYNKDTDPEYTSSSVFCSKGQGYTVPWFEADEKMHCK